MSPLDLTCSLPTGLTAGLPAPLDLSYSPPLPALTVFLTLAAVPLASALRRLGGETAHRPLPAGFGPAQIARFAASLVVLLTLWCLLPLALRPAALALEGELAGGLATLAHRAWQATALLGALALALWRITELRWPAAALRLAVGLALAPPLALAFSPAGHPALAAGAALILLWLAPRLARDIVDRWRAWRRPAVQITRRSALPAQLAAQIRLAPGEPSTQRSDRPAQLAARLRHELMEQPTQRDPLGRL